MMPWKRVIFSITTQVLQDLFIVYLYCRFFVIVSIVVAECKTIKKARHEVRKFPENFRFGTATASYQVEGAWDEDGKNTIIKLCNIFTIFVLYQKYLFESYLQANPRTFGITLPTRTHVLWRIVQMVTSQTIPIINIREMWRWCGSWD